MANVNPTSDWESIKFSGLNEETLRTSYSDGRQQLLKMKFGDYEVEFDFELNLSEEFGVKFKDKIYGVFHYEKDPLEISLDKIVSCDISFSDDGEFILTFDGNRKISFFNYHNGYYSHRFAILKRGTCIFCNYL